MGMIKHRNIKGLTEAEEVARNTDQLFFFLKKVLMAQITTMVWSLTRSQIA